MTSASAPKQLYILRARDPSALVDQLSRPPRDMSLVPAVPTGGVCLALVASPDGLAAAMQQAKHAVSGGVGVAGRDGVYYQPAPFGARALAFLFPGQGSQYAHMLSDLRVCFPAFDTALSVLTAEADARFGASFQEMIFGANAAEGGRLRTDTLWAQASLGLVSTALGQALERVGVCAAFVAGHSYGELVALRHAGAITSATLFELTLERGKLMRVSPTGAATGMLAIGADQAQVELLLRESGTAVGLANLNTPRQTVVAGTLSDLELVSRRCGDAGLRTSLLNTAAAFHSSAMQAAGLGFRAVLEQYASAGRLERPRVPVVSNLTAEPYDGSPLCIVNNLSEQLASRVRWQDCCRTLHALGARIFIEVGPGQALTRMVRENLTGRGCVAECFDGTGNQRDQLLSLLAMLASQDALAPSGNELSDLLAASPVERKQLEGSTIMSMKDSLVPELMRSSDNIFGRYLDLSGRVLDTLAAMPPSQCDAQCLTRFLEISSQMTESYLELQGRTFETLCNFSPREGANVGPRSHHASDRSPHPSAPTLQVNAVQAPDGALPQLQGEAAPHVDWLLQEVATLTGFPAQSIDPDQDMSELGIDSLAQVSLLERVARRLPDIADGLRRKLRGVKTLRDLARAIDDGKPVPAAPLASGRERRPPLPSAPADTTAEPEPERKRIATRDTPTDGGTRSLETDVCAALSAVAGTPVTPESDLDATIGLTRSLVDDTLNQLAERYPVLSLAGEHARSFTTLAPLFSFLTELTPFRSRRDSVARMVLSRMPWAIGRAILPSDLLLVGPAGPGADRVAESATSRGTRVHRLVWAGTHFLSDVDAPGVSRRTEQDVAEWLRARFSSSPSAGIVYVTSSARAHDEATFRAAVEADTVGPFYLFKALGSLPAIPCRVGVAAFAGDSPTALGARGVVRALRREWGPGPKRLTAVRINDPVLHVDGNDVLDSLFSSVDQADAVLEGGQHFTETLARRAVANAVGDSEPQIPKGGVVMMLGGGGGIATQLAIRLARTRRCRIVALGRTEWDGRRPDELACPAGAAVNGAGVRAPLPSREDLIVSRKRLQLWAAAESVRAAGGEFTYEAVDACDAAMLATAISRCQERYGRIDLVIHAAGLLDDGPFDAKDVDSFRRVVHAKVHSAEALERALRHAPPRAVVLMSSLVAHTGNAGQADYCAANEILNSMAEQWAREVDYRVVAMLWSVWTETGLANQGVRDLFAREGLCGIGTEEGFERTLGELERDPSVPAPSWVLLASAGVLRYLGASGAVDGSEPCQA